MAAYGDFQAVRIILYHALAASLLGRFPSNLAYGYLTMLPTSLIFSASCDFFPQSSGWYKKGLLQVK